MMGYFCCSLIGVRVHFVIHLAHAYSHKPGEISHGDRTKYALVKMGPSILATAVTAVLLEGFSFP